MHSFYSQFNKNGKLTSHYLLPSLDLFRRALRTKTLQTSFLSKHILGLSVLSTTACKQESKDVISSSALTQREMNLANIKSFNLSRKNDQSSIQEASVDTSVASSNAVSIATQSQPSSSIQQSLNTTVPSVARQDTAAVQTTIALNDIVIHQQAIEPIPVSTNTSKVSLSYEFHNGTVVKGPLDHALVFLDVNGDGTPVDEPFVYTKADGSYDLLEAFRNHQGQLSKAEMENANLTVFTYYNTIDTISDKPLPDVILKAPFGASVISPVTTIMAEAELTNQETASLLGITQQDFYNFNPFSPSSDLTLALEVETIGLQFAATITALSGATKGVLGDSLKILNPEASQIVLTSDKIVLGEKRDWTMLDQMLDDLWLELRSNLSASEIVLDEIVQIVKNRSTADKPFDLKSAEDIDLIIEALDAALVTRLNKSDGASANDTSDAMVTFRARSGEISSELVNLNLTISEMSDLYSKEAVETAALITGLSDKIFNTQLGNWTDTIKFTASSEEAIEKTGALKPKGSLSAFSSEADSKLWGVQAIYADKGKFLVTWTNNDPKTGNEVQLRTIDDPNGTKKFKATTGQTSFDFDYSLNEDGSPAIIVMRSYKDASLRPVSSQDFTASDGTTLVLNQPTVAGEIIEVSKAGAPTETQTFIASAGQTNFELTYDVAVDQVGISRSNVAKMTRIPDDEYTVDDGVIALIKPSEENEIVEIRKLPVKNQVIDLFSSINLQTFNPKLSRLSEDEIVIVATATDNAGDHSAIAVQIQNDNLTDKIVEYSSPKSVYIIDKDVKVPILVNSPSSKNSDPVTAVLENNSFVIGWTSNTLSVEGKDVEIQVFDAKGPVLNKRFTLNDPSHTDQHSLDIANHPTVNTVAATWVEAKQDAINTDIIYSHFDISNESGVILAPQTISLSISVFGGLGPIKIDLAAADFVNGNLIMSREAFGLRPSDFITKASVQYDPLGQFDRLNFDRTSISDMFGARDDLVQAFSKGVTLGEGLNVNYDAVLGLSVNGAHLSKQTTKITITHSGSDILVELILSSANFKNGKLVISASDLQDQLNLGEGHTIVSVVAQTDPRGNFDTSNPDGTFSEDLTSKVSDNIGTWKYETKVLQGNLELNFDPYLGIVVKGIEELGRLNHKNILKNGLHELTISDVVPVGAEVQEDKNLGFNLEKFEINYNPTIIFPEDGNADIFWTAWNPIKEVYQLVFRQFDANDNPSDLIVLENNFSHQSSDFDIVSKGNEIFVTWTQTDEQGEANIVLSSLDPTGTEESVEVQFSNNFVTVSSNADKLKSVPTIALDTDNDVFITWSGNGALTQDKLTDFQLVFDLIDLDDLDLSIASYTVPENYRIDDLKELTPFLLDQNINFLEKDLQSQMNMLDDKKVQEYLQNEGDMIFYVELKDSYSTLSGSETAIIA